MKIQYAGPLNFEKYESIISDVSGIRRYSRNILQWNKIKTNSTKMTQWRLLMSHENNMNYAKTFEDLNLCSWNNETFQVMDY